MVFSVFSHLIFLFSDSKKQLLWTKSHGPESWATPEARSAQSLMATGLLSTLTSLTRGGIAG